MPSASGPYLQSIAQARSIEWSQVWRWDCQFPGAPGAFGGWFPATAASRTVSELETHNFIGFGDTFEIPYASGMRGLSVTFADDDHATLLSWLSIWMETTMLGSGATGTRRLSAIVKQCNLAQLDARGMQQHNWSLRVFPYGELAFAGESQSTHTSYTVSFRIAGIDNPDV